ncbi:aldose 1-epimerase [Gordonia sp. CPCC 206044]|uniref:aldose epimerase family protein n=1 Tax=Gordonia sp. CPCC 206044 TaxID=3140793 RepID=UPI003AF3E298
MSGAHPDVSLDVEGAAAQIDSSTGSLASLIVDGVEVLHRGDGFGSFPMAPWCGRMRDGELAFDGATHRFDRNDPPHALHGLVRDRPWQVQAARPDRVTLVQQLDSRWPFGGTVTQEFVLAPNAMSMTMRIRAQDRPFPAQAGWHPWFRRHLDGSSAPLRVEFDPAWQEERGDDHLPTGRRIAPQPPPWDDCFGMPDGVDVVVNWPDRLRLRIRSDARFVVVYDHRDFAVCVEPQSGPPDGLNTAPVVVRPGDELVVTAEWTW